MIVQEQICLSQNLTYSRYLASGQCSGQTSDALKMTSGAVTLFFFAASLTMASDSSTRPWARSHRGDSGISLGFDRGEKDSLNQFTLDMLDLNQIRIKTLSLLLLLLALENRLCLTTTEGRTPPSPPTEPSGASSSRGRRRRSRAAPCNRCSNAGKLPA